jgi:hypothetical protein
MTDYAKIARALSPMQKDVIRVMNGTTFVVFVCSKDITENLSKLASCRPTLAERHRRPCGFEYRLTTAGVAVQKELTS